MLCCVYVRTENETQNLSFRSPAPSHSLPLNLCPQKRDTQGISERGVRREETVTLLCGKRSLSSPSSCDSDKLRHTQDTSVHSLLSPLMKRQPLTNLLEKEEAEMGDDDSFILTVPRITHRLGILLFRERKRRQIRGHSC